MVLDSNIIIYSANGNSFEELFREKNLYASVVSKIEVLGFHKITAPQKENLEAFFDSIFILELTESVADEAISLRQKRNISLGDSIIAATALVHKLPLVTANVSDFKWIEELEIIHPLLSE